MNPKAVKTKVAAPALSSAGLPLYSDAEEKKWDNKLSELQQLWHKKKLEYRDYDVQRKAVEEAWLKDTVTRAQARAAEYLNGLLIIVASQGNKALRFAEVFTLAKDPVLARDIAQADTPDNRRVLHTLLQTLSEIPDNWSALDLRRFLLGTGEQGKAKYKFSGKSFFKNSAWAESEVTIVCEKLAGESDPYAQVLRRHEVLPPPPLPEPTPEGGPDFEIVPVHRPHEPEIRERKPIDKVFIATLRKMLEERGI